jgi:type I restriction enzyme S subunit
MTMRLRGIGAPGTNSVRTPRVNVEDLGDIDVYSPALEEQRSIADFLDDQVARIDRTVEARRRQVQSTTEWLSSLLDEVVWAEPGSLPVKYLVQGITSGPRGWGELVRDEGQPFLRIGNLPSKGIDLRLDDLARVDAPDDAESRRARTRAGDVLLGITASLGDVGLVTPALAGSFISQHVARLRPRHDVDGEWLAWALQTRRVRDSLSVSGYGGTKVGLGLAEVANTHVPLCSAQTRQRVVAEARSVWEAGDRHIGLLARSTELLLELKRSMIGAAVSGEMNVSTAAGAGASV